MSTAGAAVRATAPGRVCLFGEHLDYLGLPVVAAAISLRMTAELRPSDGEMWVIAKPDLSEEDRFHLGAEEIPYVHGGAADFLRAAVNVLLREGVTLPTGAVCRVSGEVPIRAGTGSSSALQVAWISALLAVAGDPRVRDPEVVSLLAHLSEVTEFDGSGGMMDQCTAAFGGLVRIDPGGRPTVRPLPGTLGPLVLGNSLEPKDTQAILSRVQGTARRGADSLSGWLGGFDWAKTSWDEAHRAASARGEIGRAVGCALAALRNRDLLEEGHRLLSEPRVDHRRLASLLTEHHEVLRDSLETSTPKIERMIEAALTAGALGAKINGSGGGGCMFAHAPERADAVAEAIRREGAEAWVVQVDTGVEISMAEES